MTLKEYQAFAAHGIHEATLEREPIVGFALGLAGEAGEVVDDIKKRIFHGREVPMEHTAEELGDVLWYVANIATQCGFSLDDIIQQNVDKLTSRYPEKYQRDIIGVLSTGVYRNKSVKFVVNGPHIAVYGMEDDKFIKFLNKEEKIAYGLDLKENLRTQYAERTKSEDTSFWGPAEYEKLPWD